MSLCCYILGWGSLDVRKLEKLLDEYNIDIEILIQYADDFREDSTDINIYIYSALAIAEYKIKDKLKKWLKTNNDVYEFIDDELMLNVEEKIDDFEPNIYTNYLDSGFDSCFANFNYQEPTDDDYWELINEIFGLTKEDFEKWKEEQEDE
jgi:hypothetical protein